MFLQEGPKITYSSGCIMTMHV